MRDRLWKRPVPVLCKEGEKRCTYCGAGLFQKVMKLCDGSCAILAQAEDDHRKGQPKEASGHAEA